MINDCLLGVLTKLPFSTGNLKEMVAWSQDLL